MSVSSQPEVVLHIGLHKTATRYLQREVFRALDAQRYNVNPDPLWSRLRDAVRFPDRADMHDRLVAAVEAWRAESDGRTLIISEPHISGDMYGQHHDHADNAALMRSLFPQARILYFVRDHADWLQSAYRQQLGKGGSVPMHVFLNYYDGEFRPRPHRWVYGARTVEALNQRFLTIHDTYVRLFGEQAVYLFRHEDLRRQPVAVGRQLARVLGQSELPQRQGKRSHNRSYSALAIRVFHPGTARRRAPPRASDLGPPSARGPRRWLRPLARLRRLLIQHAFDRLIYVDWDLLEAEGLREPIEAHYAAEQDELAHRGRWVFAEAASDTGASAADDVASIDAPEHPSRATD